MKRKIYPLLLLVFPFLPALAQDCATLSFTCTTSESRCVATGSISVNVSGGSGNYNYKAIGPVNTPVTSSGTITGLAPGNYSILVTDLVTGCSKQLDNIQVGGSYSDPRFQLSKTDASCAGNDGTLSVINQQWGRAPFTYTLLAPSPSHVGASNTSGIFSGLVEGEYVVQLQDSCGGVQVRRITIEKYRWWFDSVSVVRADCNSADVFIRIRDYFGNTNTSGSIFNGYEYGFVQNGDTTWFGTHQFQVLLGTNRQLTLLVKDLCGVVYSTVWFLPDNLKPSLGSVQTADLTCETFAASVSGVNLSSPNFCLYDDAGDLVSCNTTGIFNNLAYGDYCILATDACYDTTITRCFTANVPAPSVDAQIDMSARTCSQFTASVTGQTNLTTPYYCLYDSNELLIACNNTGVFAGIAYGSYCIRIQDGCIDTLITRCFEAAPQTPVLTGYSITGSTCLSFGVQLNGLNLIDPQFCLYDSAGVLITCNSTGNFGNLPYSNFCVRALSCGDSTNSLCFSGSRPEPSVGTVQISDRKCATFTASLSGQNNLTTPVFCLYDASDVLVTCNATGVFADIPYGSYCIRVQNSCYDTLMTRCFTEQQPVPSVNSTIEVLNAGCASVSFRANGTNLTTPNYCLFNAADQLLACNTTGIFNGYPYGQYCITIEDGCRDTTMRVCQTFTLPKGITLSTSKSCIINSAYIDVAFTNSNAPFEIEAFHPDGSRVLSVTTSDNPYRMELPFLPGSGRYKIVGEDNCGNRDSALIAPDANRVITSTTVRGKCPSSIWQNGSGDILAACSSNHYPVVPEIISKNNTGYAQGYSSVTGGVYTFADLEPATYVIRYTQSGCNAQLFDTITVSNYAYPSQGQSAVYQCDNNGFSLSADVAGGVSPYNFQIIGSLPESPDITTASQNSAVFSINNGTVYSLIRLRTTDACGNATLSDVSVLPLQNITVRASDSCFYRTILLSVDTIPNATYQWYYKSTPVDSVLVGTGLIHSLPFFQPEEIGQYVCKVDVNSGCLTRLSSFNLTGNCFMGVLSSPIQLKGSRHGSFNRLTWEHRNDGGINRFIVERKSPGERNFSPIGTVLPQSASQYVYDDHNFGSGQIQYRLKLVTYSQPVYTNMVILNEETNGVRVYPNPVGEKWIIGFNNEKSGDWAVELIGMNGQVLWKKELRNISRTSVSYQREHYIRPGIYLLRLTNKTSNTSEIHKMVFE